MAFKTSIVFFTPFVHLALTSKIFFTGFHFNKQLVQTQSSPPNQTRNNIKLEKNSEELSKFITTVCSIIPKINLVSLPTGGRQVLLKMLFARVAKHKPSIIPA